MQKLGLIKTTKFIEVGKRIASILKNEVENQKNLATAENLNRDDFDFEVHYALSDPLHLANKLDKPLIDVYYSSSTPKGQRSSQENPSLYHIDIYTKEKTEGHGENKVDGGTKAKLEVERVLGQVLYILASAKYVNLGFDIKDANKRPIQFIGKYSFTSLETIPVEMKPQFRLTANMCMGRAIFSVDMVEDMSTLTGVEITDLSTELTVNH